MNRIGRNRVRPTLQSWCFKVVLIWLHITGSDESPTNISVSQYYRPITDITLSAQTLSVAKTLFGDYNLERDVIIHNYLTSKWKKRKAKRNVSLSETLTLWYGRKWALVVTDPKNKKNHSFDTAFPCSCMVGRTLCFKWRQDGLSCRDQSSKSYVHCLSRGGFY